MTESVFWAVRGWPDDEDRTRAAVDAELNRAGDAAEATSEGP